MLQHSITCRNTAQHVATQHYMSQHGTTCRNTAHHVATQHTMLQHSTTWRRLRACAPCRRAKTACDETRPCPRCVRLRIECCTADIKPKKTACINCHKVQREPAARHVSPGRSIDSIGVWPRQSGTHYLTNPIAPLKEGTFFPGVTSAAGLALASRAALHASSRHGRLPCVTPPARRAAGEVRVRRDAAVRAVHTPRRRVLAARAEEAAKVEALARRAAGRSALLTATLFSEGYDWSWGLIGWAAPPNGFGMRRRARRMQQRTPVHLSCNTRRTRRRSAHAAWGPGGSHGWLNTPASDSAAVLREPPRGGGAIVCCLKALRLHKAMCMMQHPASLQDATCNLQGTAPRTTRNTLPTATRHAPRGSHPRIISSTCDRRQCAGNLCRRISSSGSHPTSSPIPHPPPLTHPVGSDGVESHPTPSLPYGVRCGGDGGDTPHARFLPSAHRRTEPPQWNRRQRLMSLRLTAKGHGRTECRRQRHADGR